MNVFMYLIGGALIAVCIIAIVALVLPEHTPEAAEDPVRGYVEVERRRDG